MLTERGTVQLVTFFLDDQRYALRLDAVERVIPAVALTQLPGAPEIVLGLIDFEGRIVPVVDIRARFRLPGREMGIEDCIIIATTARRTLAILVGVPDEVIEKGETEIDRGDGILMGSEYIEGVLRLEGGLVSEERITRFAASESGFTDGNEFIERITSSPMSREQLEVLASHLTVGETYYFRDKETFQVLQERIIPQLVQKRRAEGRFLRIWSAGCVIMAAGAACFFDKDTDQNALTEARRNAGESARPKDTTSWKNALKTA